MQRLFDRPPYIEVAPGAIHLPRFLHLDAQRHLVATFEEWRHGPVPLRRVALPGGHRMSVEMLCLGWHWIPYRYTRTADDVNGLPVLPFPDWLAELGRAALRAAAWDSDETSAYRPDVALVNFYDGDAKLGMHQDKDEASTAPVVSLSIGDAARFRFGNVHDRGQPYTDVELLGGDAFVFGGPSRLAFHGVPSTRPKTGDPASGLVEVRLNITMRVLGAGARGAGGS